MNTTDERDIYASKDRTIKFMNVGDFIEALPKGIDFSNVKEKKKYRVFGVYPYHVTGIAEDGEIRSFCLGELVKLGLEPSGARIADAGEAMVKDYD